MHQHRMSIAVYVRNTCTYNVLNISSDSCVFSLFLLGSIPLPVIVVNGCVIKIHYSNGNNDNYICSGYIISPQL